MAKILAIDDNKDNLISLKTVINDALPYSIVFSAQNGPAGIELAIAYDPDVILLDILMPGMDGFEVCRRLKQDERVQNIPVVFLTALKSSKEIRNKALEMGAEAFIFKPIDETELIAQIRTMVKVKAANNQKRDENERLAELVLERTQKLELSQLALENLLDDLKAENEAHRKTEFALKESEKRFRHISSSISDISYSCKIEPNGNSTIDWLYGATEKITGYNVDELLAMKCWGKIVTNDDFPLFQKHILGVPPGSSDSCQLRLKKKDGNLVWVQVSSECAKEFADSGVASIYGGLVDITERKRAEEKLKESEMQFKDFFEKAADAIFIAEIDSEIIVDANQAASRLMQLPQDKIIGVHQSQLHPKEDGTYSYDTFTLHKQETEQKNPTSPFENKILRPDGSLVPVEILASEVTMNGKKCLMGTFRDISKRKQVELALSESEKSYRLLVEQSPTGIAIYQEGKFVYVNPAGLAIFGGSDYNDIIGKSVISVVHPDSREEVIKRIGLISNGVAVPSMEEKLIRFDGSPFYAEVAALGITYNNKPAGQVIVWDITDRKLAEEELTKSISLLNATLESTADGILVVDRNGMITNFNKKFAELWQIPESVISTRNDSIFLSFVINQLKDPQSFLTKVEELYLKTEETSFDVLEFKDGRIFERYSQPQQIEGKSVGRVWSFRDITGRKQAELALRESEYFFKESQRAAFVGSYKFDLINDIWTSSEVLEQIFGIDKSNNRNLLGWIDIVHPDDREMMASYFSEEVVSKRKPFNKEYRIVCKSDGQVKWVLGLGKLDFDDQGHVVSMIGTIQDITERKRADLVQQVLYEISNAALSSIELTELIEIIRNQLGKLLDSTNFYIAFYDEASDMLSTEFDEDEKDQIDRWPAEKSITGYVIRYKKSLLARVADVMKLQESSEIEIIGTPSKVWLGVPMILNGNAIGAIVVQSYDNPDAYSEKDKLMLEFISDQISITIERKRAEKKIKEALIQAQESDRLKSAFLANMSHEIRTPLNSIIGFSDLMLDPYFEASQHIEFANIIKENGNNLLAIISDIMDLSKIEAGQVEVKKQLFSMNHLINEIQKEYSFRAIEKGIEFKIDNENKDENILIETDETKLRQILVNLISNAIKFTEKGSIEIGIISIDDYLQFLVKDTGIGIPKAYHKTIFERFRQVETAHTRKYGGNGLGLPISKSLVELLGGKIWMESEPGEGTSFYFKIPKI